MEAVLVDRFGELQFLSARSYIVAKLAPCSGAKTGHRDRLAVRAGKILEMLFAISETIAVAPAKVDERVQAP